MNSEFNDSVEALVSLGILALWVLFVVAMFWFLRRRSSVARRNAGKLLTDSFPMRFPKLPRTLTWFRGLIGVVCFLLYWRNPVFMLLITSGLVFSWAFLYWLKWSGMARLELRERGIVWGGTDFRPWSEIKWYRWDESPEFRFIFQCTRMRGECPLHAEDRDAIDRILSEYVVVGMSHAHRTTLAPCASC